MTCIELDASCWLEPDRLFGDLLSALAAPKWHGRNLDALWDSVCDDLDGLGPPLTVRVVGSAGSPLDRRGFPSRVAEARAEHGLNHTFELT